MVCSVYALCNIWTLDKRSLRVLLPTPAYCLNMTSVRFQSVHILTDVRKYTQERSFLTLRDKTAETRKADFWSVMLSEKNLDQKGKMKNFNKQKPLYNEVERLEWEALMLCKNSRPQQEEERVLFFPGKNSANESPWALCLLQPS